MSKPRIILSRCFLSPVRYDGGMISDDFVEKLKGFVEFIDICPELDIGLGVPRQRLIVVKEQESKRLVQPDTGKDFTEKIRQYADKMFRKLSDIDGFLLKSKSPSCGVGSTKIYCQGSVVQKSDGIFAEASKNYFSRLPIEDEGRLKDKDTRFHFLTRIFAYADFRQLYENLSPFSLVNFHTRYKYLLMTYNQKALRELGRIVADGKLNIKEKAEKYRETFYYAFKNKPSRVRFANTFMHIYGYVSDNLNNNEKRHLIGLIEKYRNNLVELGVIIELLKSLAYRFEISYLLNQKCLIPFPEELRV